MFQELYSNYGNLEAMGQAVQDAPEISPLEDTRGYSLDDLYAVGAAKQAAIDEHNLNLAYTDESFIKAIGKAWYHDTGTGVAVQRLIESDQELDPEFKLDVAITAADPILQTPTNKETLGRAKNQEHFDMLADNLMDYEEHKLNIEKLGFVPGLAAQGFAEAANLVNYVPFFRAFGLAKMDKIGKLMKGAAVQGALNVAEEKVIDTAYNDRTVASYVGAFGMGAAFTGVLGALPMINTKAEMRMKDADANAEAYGTMHVKDSADENIATAKHGPKQDRDYTNSGPVRNAERKLDPKVEDDMTAKGYDTASEASIAAYQYAKKGLLAQADTVPQQKIGIAGFAQTLASSGNRMTRYINRVLFEHGEGNYGYHKEHTAALEAATEADRLFAGYGKSLIEAKGMFGALAEPLGIKQAEFDRIAYRYIDGGHKALDPRMTPELTAILDEFKDVYIKNRTELNKHCDEAGVDEFRYGDMDDEFLYRKYDPQAFYDLTQKLGDGGEGIKVMLEESIHRGGGWQRVSDGLVKERDDLYKAEIKEWEAKAKTLEDVAGTHKKSMDTSTDFVKKTQAEARYDKAVRKLDEYKKTRPEEPAVRKVDQQRLVRKIAEAVYNRMHLRATSNTADANIFSSSNRTMLMEALNDLKLPKEDMDHIQAVLDKQGRDQKANPTAERIKMDMSVSRTIDGQEVSMLDLLDIDLGSGYYSAGRYWVGRAALARKGDHFASEEAIQKTLSDAKKEGERIGMSSEDILKEADTMQKGIQLVLAQPLERTDTMWNKGMRSLRKLVGASSLGKLGVVQAGETGRMIGAVEASYRFPMVKDLVQGVLTGKMNTAAFKSIEDAVVGNIGAREVFQHPYFRADDFGVKVNKMEQKLDAAGYYLSKASGWNRIHKKQQEALMNTLCQQWYRQVMDGTMKRSQMNDLGVDDLLMADLKREMTKHAFPIEGLSGKKTVMELNPEEWDPGVRRKFGMMLTRKANNAIQEINVGETPMWLNSEIGKFLGQFRTFSVAALSKQTTRDYKMLREGDMEAAVSMAFNTATSVMANVAKVGFVATTLPEQERKKYLERALNPASIANQILSYVGPLSPLMEASNLVGDTMFGDVYQDIAGSKMGFRAKGLTTMVPALSYINKGYKGVSGIAAGALTDKDISKTDYKALYSTMPFGNNYMFEAINNRVLTPTLFE